MYKYSLNSELQGEFCNFKALAEREKRGGQRVIDKSFQSTVYPSEEVHMHCRAPVDVANLPNQQISGSSLLRFLAWPLPILSLSLSLKYTRAHTQGIELPTRSAIPSFFLHTRGQNYDGSWSCKQIKTRTMIPSSMI